MENNKMEDSKILDLIHTNIHAIRMMPKYSPTEFEKKIGIMIIEKYQDKCAECKEQGIRLKYSPQQQKGFLTKIGDILK